MRRTIVLLVFAVGVAAGLWLSLFETEESQRPRVYTEKEAVRDQRQVPFHRSGDEGRRDVSSAAADGSADSREADDLAARPARPQRLADAGRGLDAGSSGSLEPASDLADAPDVDPRSEREIEREQLEERAASVALSLGLISPRDLEQRVAREVPDGSLPPDVLEHERDRERRKILADRAIIEILARKHAGPDAQYRELQDARDWADTLLSMQDQDYIDKMLAEVAENAEE